MILSTALDTRDFEAGESIAVNGVCLTVAGFRSGAFEADASPETLQRSTLKDLRSGDPVNLERALRPIDRLGGHFVLGHVDDTGRLEGKRREGDFWFLRFAAAASVTHYLVEKGSVALDGVSLTVNTCDENALSVAVIPHTLERTNLSVRRPGDRVNIEVDILGKYVEKFVQGNRTPGGLTLDLLGRSGFLD